jgi:magnesium-protoporphyrin IX monomethyl ester (oxidative) cyclase
MRILLVNPPMPRNYYNKEVYIPLSLLYLASTLVKKGEDVKILDMRIFQRDGAEPPQEFFAGKLTESIKDFRPDVVGLGCLFSGNFPETLELSRVSKRVSPSIPVVIGGIHPTIYAAEILRNCPSVDYIVLSEGEHSFADFISAMKNGNGRLGEIDGLAYKRAAASDTEVVINPKTRYIENIDEISFPAYDLINIRDYYVDTSAWHNPKNLPIDTSIPILTSRSCPNRCNFCSMFLAMGPRWRARSAVNVADEIQYLYNKYNRRHFSIMDDNFSLDKKRTLEICNEIIKRNLNLQFETPNGLSMATLDKEILDALVAAGMIRTCFAIESGSDYIRNDVMRKRLPREKIFKIIELAKKYKQLNIAAFFIIGMPEDTLDTLEDTYQMIKDINIDRVFLMNLVPFPGTEVFEQCLRDNLLVEPDPKKLYLAGDRYFTNYESFFLKPYRISISDLQNFRRRCESLKSVKSRSALQETI